MDKYTNIAYEALTEGITDQKYCRKVKKLLEAPSTDSDKDKVKAILSKLGKYASDRKYSNFGDISKSAGDITTFSGYSELQEITKFLSGLNTPGSEAAKGFIKIIIEGVRILTSLKGDFKSNYTKSKVIAVIYNSYLYAVVQAVTSLLSQYIKVTIDPKTQKAEIVIANSKYKANLFYFKQLEKYNTLCASKEFKQIISDASKGVYKEDATGVISAISGGLGAAGMAIGGAIGTATGVLGIVIALFLLVRMSVILFFRARVTLTKQLEEWTSFLELRNNLYKSGAVGGNLSSEKKESIMKKQVKYIEMFTRICEVIRVQSDADVNAATTEVGNDNQEIETTTTGDDNGDGSGDFLI
jgi:hypothetical protein